jgi:hypothetical protein
LALLKQFLREKIMKGKDQWVVSSNWDVTSGAGPPKVICFHIHDDGTEHPCDISPMTEFCERSLIAGKCRPETVIRCLACGEYMNEEDKITFRL